MNFEINDVIDLLMKSGFVATSVGHPFMTSTQREWSGACGWGQLYGDVHIDYSSMTSSSLILMRFLYQNFFFRQNKSGHFTSM